MAKYNVIFFERMKK